MPKPPRFPCGCKWTILRGVRLRASDLYLEGDEWKPVTSFYAHSPYRLSAPPTGDPESAIMGKHIHRWVARKSRPSRAGKVARASKGRGRKS